MTIRLLVFDIDGVLTGGEAIGLDLALLGQLADLNRRARKDARLPAATICSGRPAPYVEALLQAIDGRLPAVFENGAGLYQPEGYQFLPHPDLNGGNTMSAVRRRLEETVIRTRQAYIQPGKEYSLSLFPYRVEEVNRLAGWVADALGPLNDGVDLVYSVSCLNILLQGSSKARGIEFLASRVGVPPEEMLGVGDAEVDTGFLQLVGYSAAPANAVAEVKAVVDYISPFEASDGVRDILKHFAIG
jgi:hypothetical protein